MDNTIVIDSLPGNESLRYLRDRELHIEKFRQHSETVCELLISEVTKDIDTQEVVAVPILRAGLAMLSPVLRVIPTAKLGFVGLERDEQTAVAKEYYWKLPPLGENTTVLILDPMLATGGSVHHVLELLKDEKVKEIRLVCVIAAPEGIEKVHTDFPDIRIVTAAVDEGLDAKKFIVPGLGDYGDRYFGT